MERERLRFSVLIHEHADVAGAEQFRAGLTGTEGAVLNKKTLKKHNPRTSARTSATCRGCPMIKVLKGAELYRRIQGSWYGIVLGAARPVGEMSD